MSGNNTMSELDRVSKRVTVSEDVNESVTVSENVNESVTVSENDNESVTVSENVKLCVRLVGDCVGTDAIVTWCLVWPGVGGLWVVESDTLGLHHWIPNLHISTTSLDPKLTH